jgi:hypothetical protein
MVILDLQEMETPESHDHAPKGSRASKGCFNDHSSFSLLIC